MGTTTNHLRPSATHLTPFANNTVEMSSGNNHRLYVKGKHLSFQRGKRNTNPNTSLGRSKVSTTPTPQNSTSANASHSSTEPQKNDKAARSESSGERSPALTATAVSSEPSSSTTFLPRASVLASESCCTQVRYNFSLEW